MPQHVINPAQQNLDALLATQPDQGGLLSTVFNNISRPRRQREGREKAGVAFEAQRELTADAMIAAGVTREALGDDRFETLGRVGNTGSPLFSGLLSQAVQTQKQFEQAKIGVSIPLTAEQSAQRDFTTRKRALDLGSIEAMTRKNLSSAELNEFNLGVRENLAPIELALKKQQLAEATAPQAVDQPDAPGVTAIPETVAVMNPITGVPANVPITGATYVKNQTAADAMQRSLVKVNEMIGLIGEYNTELGGDIGTRMNQLRFGIIVGSNQAAGAGAPTGNEMEEVAKGLRDPTGIFNNLLSLPLNLIPGAVAEQKESLISGYQQYSKDISLALKQQMAINPAINNVDYSLLDPSVWQNADERAYFEANTGRNWLESR